MKKWIASIVIGALSLSLLAGCAEDVGQELPDSQPSQVQTQPTASEMPTQPREEGAVLDSPEKCVSLEDVDEMTITVVTSSSYGVARRITYSLRDAGGVLTLYERNTEASLAAEEFYGYESLCVVAGDTAAMYSNQKISGAGFQRVDLSGEYDRDDGYLRGELANLGFDHWEHIVTDGFTKCEDTTYLGRDCYVYKLAYTDRVGAAYKAQITVDKQTGIWLRSERTVPGSDDSFLMEVESLEDSAAVIPGSAPVQTQGKTLYEKDGIFLAAKRFDWSDPDHAVLVLEVRNDRQEDIRLSSHYLNVDGLCLGGDLIGHICGAGQTQQILVELPNQALDRAGIEMIREIRFALWIEQVHMESDPQGDYAVVDEVLVSDTGELVVETDAPDGPAAVTPEGTVLWDDDQLRLLSTSAQVEASGDAWIGFYCEDRCAEPVRTTVYIKSVNGISCDLQGRIVMQERCRGFDGFRVSRDKLLELGIEKIESLELCFEVFLGESFMSTECIVELTEPVTVTFQ